MRQFTRLALALVIALSVILPAGIVTPSLPSAPESVSAEAGCSVGGNSPRSYWSSASNSMIIWASGYFDCYGDYANPGTWRTLQVCVQRINVGSIACSSSGFTGDDGYLQASGPCGSYPSGTQYRVWTWMKGEDGTTQQYYGSWLTFNLSCW